MNAFDKTSSLGKVSISLDDDSNDQSVEVIEPEDMQKILAKDTPIKESEKTVKKWATPDKMKNPTEDSFIQSYVAKGKTDEEIAADYQRFLN